TWATLASEQVERSKEERQRDSNDQELTDQEKEKEQFVSSVWCFGLDNKETRWSQGERNKDSGCQRRERGITKNHTKKRATEGTSTSKEIDVKKDSSASAYLFQGLPEDLQMQVAGCETAKEIWDSLKSRFIGTEDVQHALLVETDDELALLMCLIDEN
ncbi:hypothetical protein Tco_1388174, partial [Tanacetum coccineum]